MLCFRDQTFCASNCVRSECEKHFGPDDKEAAEAWAKRIGLYPAVPVSRNDHSGECPDYRPAEGE